MVSLKLSALGLLALQAFNALAAVSVGYLSSAQGHVIQNTS